DDFAAAIPVQLIGDLLGIPETERGPLRKWSLAILGGLEPVLSKAQFEAGTRAVDEFKDYLTDLIARRTRDKTHDEREILSTLIGGSELAGGSDGEERLSELELLHNCIFLLNAGHETTPNLLGNSVHLLLQHPDARRELSAHPELIAGAVEEFLRMESSNQLGNRRATCETESAAKGFPPTPTCICASARPTVTPASFPIRTGSTFAGIQTAIWHSASAFTPVPEIRWRAMEGQVAIGKLVTRFKSIERAGDFVRGGRARFRGFLHYRVARR